MTGYADHRLIPRGNDAIAILRKPIDLAALVKALG